MPSLALSMHTEQACLVGLAYLRLTSFGLIRPMHAADASETSCSEAAGKKHLLDSCGAGREQAPEGGKPSVFSCEL